MSTPETTDFIECPAWQGIRGVWKPVCGGIFEHGFSLEWHDFHASEAVDWAKSFHEEALEICLNFGGEGSLGGGKTAREIGAGQTAVYSKHEVACRNADCGHRFFTLEVTPDFLRERLAPVMDNLRPEVVRFLEKPKSTQGLLDRMPLAASLLPLRMHLLEPPVFPSAHALWYQGKILDILSATVFREDRPVELFCSQNRRINRERVERARFLLERDMEDPPSLDMLATEVGCSAFHLSRIFAQECGVSIPRYLRQRRVEKAAEMLREGRMSVTEVAVAVGYSSISAFIKAFVEFFGVLPSHYQAGDRGA